MGAVLAVRDLCKTYASHDLFDRLSLTFHEGDRVGLIGPNGVGKTTLLRILAGIEPPDSGSVDRAKGAHIAYLPQIDVFPAGATVEGALLGALAGEVRREVEWLRRGPRARGTKAAYRINAAQEKIERLSGARRWAFVLAGKTWA